MRCEESAVALDEWHDGGCVGPRPPAIFERIRRERVPRLARPLLIGSTRVSSIPTDAPDSSDGGASSRRPMSPRRTSPARLASMSRRVSRLPRSRRARARCRVQPRGEASASRAFCRAADDYNEELERSAETRKADVERQLPLVKELARTAPAAIADDTATFVDALEQVEVNPSVRDDPAVRTAVNNVNRYANQACNVYERKGL